MPTLGMSSLFTAVLLALVAGTLGRSLDVLIIGGSDAAVGEFPHQGSLQRGASIGADGAPTYLGHTCGCSLLSANWVITAAHCVGAGADGLSVVMGLHKRWDRNVGMPQRYQISAIYKHAEFNRWILLHDIALLKMQSSVQMNRYVRPISMAPADTNFEGQTCIISGWGVTTSGGGKLANTLQKADVTVYTNANCQIDWNVSAGQICIGIYKKTGACNGDSGGPLVCDSMLAGLTSYGNNGCFTNQPSVYTRVSFYRDWIFNIAGI